MAKAKKKKVATRKRPVAKKKKVATKRKVVAKRKRVAAKKHKKVSRKPKSVIEMSKEKFNYFMAKIASI